MNGFLLEDIGKITTPFNQFRSKIFLAPYKYFLPHLNAADVCLLALADEAELGGELLEGPEVVVGELRLAASAGRRREGEHAAEFDSLRTSWIKIRSVLANLLLLFMTWGRGDAF